MMRIVRRELCCSAAGAHRRMKVCFVLPSLAGGGAERVAVTVLSGLDGSRHERLLYLFSREGVYLDRLAPDVRVVTRDAAVVVRTPLRARRDFSAPSGQPSSCRS